MGLIGGIGGNGRHMLSHRYVIVSQCRHRLHNPTGQIRRLSKNNHLRGRRWLHNDMRWRLAVPVPTTATTTMTSVAASLPVIRARYPLNKASRGTVKRFFCSVITLPSEPTPASR